VHVATPASRVTRVRQINFDVRIDPNISPVEDSQFRIRPGLAGTGTVSFESVNHPGYFLRHANYDFQLALNDGSSQFAADATFRKVAGLADATWSSFQSYNYPDRYIHHYAYELRLDPITTTTGRGDATFRVTS
ncbi:AbfB domain-containing protein, partial [Streptomyces sp. MCAF7]